MALRLVPSATVHQSESTAPQGAEDTIPAAPPPELGAEMEACWRRSGELRDQGRELRFDRDERGRVVGRLLDLDGNLIRTVLASEALEIAIGGTLCDSAPDLAG